MKGSAKKKDKRTQIELNSRLVNIHPGNGKKAADNRMYDLVIKINTNFNKRNLKIEIEINFANMR